MLRREWIGKRWRAWRQKTVSASWGTVCLLLTAVIFFLLGGYRSEPEFRKMELALEEAKRETRRIAKGMAEYNRQLNDLRAQDRLNRKTIDLLNERLNILAIKNIEIVERNNSYQEVLLDRLATAGILVHSMEANPEADDLWKINAVVVRFDRRKTFTGGYYFEVTEEAQDETLRLIRLPGDGTKKIEIRYHHEIDEEISLAPQSTVENVRLYIVDQSGEIVVSETMKEIVKSGG